LLRHLSKRLISAPTKPEAGEAAAPVETVNVDVPDGVVRNQPQEVFKEAKQAVDLTQPRSLCRWGAHQGAEKYRTGQAVGGCAGGELRGVASDLR